VALWRRKSSPTSEGAVTLRSVFLMTPLNPRR